MYLSNVYSDREIIYSKTLTFYLATITMFTAIGYSTLQGLYIQNVYV